MNKEIIIQVAFKGAVECAVNGKAEVNEIRNLTNLFTDIMLDEMSARSITTPEVKMPFEPEFANEPTPSEGDVSNKASVKQENYVKKLYSQLPEEEKLKYADGIKASFITWQYANEHIKKFKAILGYDDNVQENKKSDLPF